MAFSTSGTNAPCSLSQVKAGTHSASLKKSHTRAHTAKQGASLLCNRAGHLTVPHQAKEQPEETDVHAYGVCPLPPAPQPRWAAQHSFRPAYVVFLTLGTRGFLRVRGEGGTTALWSIRRPSVCMASRNLSSRASGRLHSSINSVSGAVPVYFSPAASYCFRQ